MTGMERRHIGDDGKAKVRGHRTDFYRFLLDTRMPIHLIGLECIRACPVYNNERLDRTASETSCLRRDRELQALRCERLELRAIRRLEAIAHGHARCPLGCADGDYIGQRYQFEVSRFESFSDNNLD